MKKNIGATLALYPAPVIVVGESWLKEAVLMGTTSGNKRDKSQTFAFSTGEHDAPHMKKRFVLLPTLLFAGIFALASCATTKAQAQGEKTTKIFFNI